MRYRLAFLLTVLATNCLAQSGGLINGTRGVPQPNDGTTGTVINTTAIINSAGNAVQPTAAAITSAPGTPVRIVVGGAGTTGNAVLASTGTLAPCVMDAAVASGGGGYYVLASTTTNGQCHPQSAAPATGTWVIGFLHDSTTTAGSTALVHMNGFIYPSTTTGAGSGTVSPNTGATTQLAYYPGAWAASRYYGVNVQILDSNNNIQRVTASASPNTSGTTAPTWATTVGNTTTDANITWTMVGPGSSTTVVPAGTSLSNGVAISTTGNGLFIGFGQLQFGGSLGAAWASLGSPVSGLIMTGGGTSTNLSTWLKAANTIITSSDVVFTSSASSVLIANLPAQSANWILQCVVPITITGSGAATLTVQISNSQTPSGATTLSAMYQSAAGTPASQVTNTVLSASGTTPVLSVSITDISLLPATGASVYLNGMIRAPSAGGTVNLNVATSNGTGAVKAGAFCRYD